MKIGKYPVKHSYKIPRIIADVFSVGLAVFICSVEIMFMTVYDDTLKTYIGGEALEKLMQADSSLGWKHWLTLIFPAAVLAGGEISSIEVHYAAVCREGEVLTVCRKDEGNLCRLAIKKPDGTAAVLASVRFKIKE